MVGGAGRLPNCRQRTRLGVGLRGVGVSSVPWILLLLLVLGLTIVEVKVESFVQNPQTGGSLAASQNRIQRLARGQKAAFASAWFFV